MSLDKAIAHGKEHRRPYRGSEAIFKSCRNHGGCPWCKGDRRFKFRDKHPDADFDFYKNYYGEQITNKTEEDFKMMNMKKTASVTRVMGEGDIGLSMFGLNEDVNEEDLQMGIDVALTVMPAIFKCVQRHLDDFEGEEKEILAVICETYLS